MQKSSFNKIFSFLEIQDQPQEPLSKLLEMLKLQM